MANREHLKILKKGVDAWNQWRQANPLIRPDLRDGRLSNATLRRADLGGADLSGANLDRADLISTNLRGADLNGATFSWAKFYQTNFMEADLGRADLRGAHLRRANFYEANLHDANLAGAELTWVNLSGADLGGADLSGTDLRISDLRGADLCGTDFSGAVAGATTFADVDLSKARGLEKITHGGPSTIGIDTMYRSQGRIPEVFLRGAGVPENFIEYMHSLVGAALHYYSCFISYSSKDQEFADRLHADLQDKGVRCWLATEDLKIGDKFRQRIDEAIRFHDKLLVVLSQNSVNSAWVEEEVEAAFARERKEDKPVLFPVRLDDAVMKTDRAWAATLQRMRHIGDFTQWRDHDSYKRAFERLLRDLRGEKEKEAAAE